MKQIKYILFLSVGILLFSCTEKLPVYNNADNRLGFEYLRDANGYIEDSITRYTFVYFQKDLKQDTIWIDIRTVGFLSNVSRPFLIKQVPISKNDLKEYRDLEDFKPLNAESGKHYIPFTDSKLVDYMTIAPGTNKRLYPIVVLRDPSLKNEKYYIKLQIADNENFIESYPGNRFKIIEVSDILTKPKYWTGTGVYYFLGKYSPEKLEFMVNSATWKVNEEWFSDLFKDPYSVDMGYCSYLSGYFTQKLVEYNRKRIAEGKDVLRETPSKPGEVGAIVRFNLYGSPTDYK